MIFNLSLTDIESFSQLGAKTSKSLFFGRCLLRFFGRCLLLLQEGTNSDHFHLAEYCNLGALKVVTSEKIGGSGVRSTLGTWYGGVVMGVLSYFNEAAILYSDFNSAPSQKQNIIVFAANNSRCCECYVAPTIIL